MSNSKKALFAGVSKALLQLKCMAGGDCKTLFIEKNAYIELQSIKPLAGARYVFGRIVVMIGAIDTRTPNLGGTANFLTINRSDTKSGIDDELRLPDD